MASEYVMQIVHQPTGQIVEFAPGLRIESQLQTELLDRVKAKGVGLGRTEAHVLTDVEAAFRELLHDLKSQV